MIFVPKPFGTQRLSRAQLAADKKSAYKAGPCGVGEKALYFNSFYFPRRYYVCWSDLSRVFKRVALSRGGFTGKGVFASMPYLVVQLKDGQEKQCNFKFESKVDDILARVSRDHPEIPIHSAQAEAKLRKQQKEQDALYLKRLSPQAKSTVAQLTAARDALERSPQLYKQLAYAARQKRIIDNIKPAWQAIAFLVAIASLCSSLYGLYLLQYGQNVGLMFALFGAGALVMTMATRILPTKGRNRRAAQRDWQQAESEMAAALQHQNDFPVPPRYAHPVVLNRMIRAVRQGRAADASSALKVVANDLKALNSRVTVTQKEYDEVTAVKPLFLVCNYK
ncbi:MAG: hypothetical protein ACOYD9_02290 [Pyramidobacter sp.]|jgi:hypothetical protein